MTFKETMAKLFSTAEGTYYKWKKENRPIINLLETYFTKEELEEFISTNEIKKLELIKNYSLEELENKLNTQQVIYDDDYIIKNLTFKFLMFNNKKALISLRKIIDELPNFNVNKNDLLRIMQNYPVSFFSVETKNDKKTAIFFIDKLLTNYEVNLLIKYRKEIFTSFYDIEDIKVN
ncbi:hypothetical protein N5U05_02785 [Aliarcobacter butzleri]|uniref:hypothetical protein n=1 Tax=Aliarcobacter butzleri TaxID=28197 RepID=UPI0021B1D564|nr:hypothetical protein [Aliarcobacter butzleri]MCT7616655.1 hypothetical protein [Aliarcobacter butzleri]